MRTLAPDLKGVCTTCSYETEWFGEFEDFNAQLGVCPNCGHQLELFDNLQSEPEWLYEFESEIEAEINRSSKTYIKWVQQSLNKIIGAGLTVDGLRGPNTRNAIRTFQRRVGITVDGKVGSQTEKALIKAGAGTPPSAPTSSSTTQVAGLYPAVNTLMPQQGPGFRCRQPPSRRYGLPETIHALIHIGAAWYNRHPKGPEIVISDISKRGGGTFPPHKSHQIGLDVDLSFNRTGGKRKVCSGDADYSTTWRPLIQDLIQVIGHNGFLPVKTIGFCDRKCGGKPYRVSGVLISPWSGHSCHLHVRFCMPSQYKATLSKAPNFSGYQCI